LTGQGGGAQRPRPLEAGDIVTSIDGLGSVAVRFGV